MQKIAIINNGSRRIDELKKSLLGNDISVITYDGAIDSDYLDSFDALVLSGSSKNEAYNPWYDPQVDFIKTYNKPLLGICLGLELICRAYDLPIVEIETKVEGTMPINATEDFASLFGNQHFVREAHKWVLRTISNDFRVMFLSETGIEGIVHKQRKVVGVQFHPEVITEIKDPITVRQLLDFAEAVESSDTKSQLVLQK